MGSRDVLWVRNDVFGNKVSLYARRWTTHVSKHMEDEVPSSEEHIYQTVVNPDLAYESLDPVIGTESCVFEKFFEVEGQRFLVPVLYDELDAPKQFMEGSRVGSVLTGYFPNRARNSSSIGPVIWSRESLIENESLPLAANAEEEEQG